MAEVADFVVIDRDRVEAAAGKWTSVTFATGGRNSGRTAYALLMLGVGTGAPDSGVEIRVIVNDHPVPTLISVETDSTTTATATFPAAQLHDGGGNVLKLHARNEASFFLHHAIVHFRQNS